MRSSGGHPGYLAFAASAAPALGALAFVLRYGVDVPFYDQWIAEAPLFEKVWQHRWTVGDFWAQHNEHRIVFPKLLYVALAWFTQWNVRAELVATWALVCVTSFAIYRCQRSTAGVGTAPRMLQLLLANVLLFSPAPFETWLWGINVQNILAVTCAVSSLAVACSEARFGARMAGCIALAVIATFSTLGGLLSWFLPLPLLFVDRGDGDGRSRRVGAVMWGVALACTTLLYFHAYEKPPGHPSLADALRAPADATEFLLIYAGNILTPLSHAHYMALAKIIGGVLVILYAAACGHLVLRWHDRRLVHRSLVWILVGLYAVLNGVLITVGRLGFGPSAATWSRYETYSELLPLALVFLIPIVVSDLSRRGRAAGARAMLNAIPLVLSVVMTVFLGVKSVEAVAIMRFNRVKRLQGKAALLFVDAFRDDSIRTFVTKTDADVRPIADTLSRLGLLHPPLVRTRRMQDLEGADSPRQPYGALQLVTRADADGISITGWTFNPGTGWPADAVVLSYDAPNGDAVPFAIADMTLDRPEDSGVPRGTPAATWRVVIPPSRLPTGATRICGWALDIGRAEATRLAGCRDVPAPR